ncbi:MAG TPA: multicopper oxidase domain-containing protein [Actinophytocola sp.]|uniref:multicopper oxidase family protein n=1 Tax=Actinophytocola sp. TaxID=1872138 RepID=UPI002DDDB7AA|nr:multicopper oxidase domain-containing protein [Actinophytocola sp.]HEV2778621.1 multicopper oxidase domain-containing protein [Actinophytocola sp.]
MADRRAVLRWGLAGTLGLALPAGTAVVSGGRSRGPAAAPSAAEDALPTWAFGTPLPIPAVLRPVSTEGGVDRYEIVQREGRQRIVPDATTAIWGYDGTFPGPTIEARRGRPVVVTHRNELPAPTVVHLHGGVVPPQDDGHPLDLVLPVGAQADAVQTEHARHGVAGLAAGSRAYAYANDQPAATLWYHDHRMAFTGPQVYRGLAGFYLIRDDAEDALALPRGERDIPLLIADRQLAPDGSLFYPAADPTGRRPGVTERYHHSGMAGETVTVNGVAWPFLEVDAALYRLRFLNASNARPYRLVLDPPPPGGNGFVQIGSDVGLLPRPVRYEMFVISPGERYDMLVDFSRYQPGTRVTLRNNVGDGTAGHVMRFVVARRARDDARVPETLVPDARPPAKDQPGADRRWAFFSGPQEGTAPPMVNFQLYDMTRIDARPTLGSTEIWDITADPTHPIHLHMAHFRILRRNGGPPEPQDAGWKDTVFVPSGGMRIAVTFTGHRGRYVLHCHNLEHGDTGMMANLEVT